MEARVRPAVRRSALTRLFAWCQEVGLSPVQLWPADLLQFREWLHEIGSTRRETVTVARQFIAWRRSLVGREDAGDSRRPLAIELEAPLVPRFNLESFPGQSNTGVDL